MATSDFDGDIDYAPLWAGESCSTIGDIKPAAQIIQDLIRDAQAALDDDTDRVTNVSGELRRPKGRVKSVAESAGSGAFEGEARADGSE